MRVKAWLKLGVQATGTRSARQDGTCLARPSCGEVLAVLLEREQLMPICKLEGRSGG